MQRRIGMLVCIAFMAASPAVADVLTIGNAIEVIADRLEAEQIKDGLRVGSWPSEPYFTGSIVPGVVSAYELLCDPNYKISAELGGDYIIWAAHCEGNFYGDDLFALTRLSQISTEPCDLLWDGAVSDFYDNVKHDPNGTQGYISAFSDTEPSTAVFYLANHVVAAYFVDAEDKLIWRQGLIDYLVQVDDDSADFPVMALGIATWALAQTGDLDGTILDPNGTGCAYWDGVTLADLPDMLLSHQVPLAEEYAGSFYWKFGHGDCGSGCPVSGYTEDTIFGALGVAAAFGGNPPFDVEQSLLSARQALLSGVSGIGVVYEHLWLKGSIYYTYAGEMLHILAKLIIPGDLNLDGGVNFKDFAILANKWLACDCAACPWCNHADINQDGQVNHTDLEVMVNNWLKGFDN